MSTDQLKGLGKQTVVPVQLGTLFILFFTAWRVATLVSDVSHRIDRIELISHDRWTAHMEYEAWREYERTGIIPNVDQIRNRYNYP